MLIGTADKGRIYSVTNDGRDTLLLQSPEGQISSLLVRNNQVYAASSNQGKLFRFGNELVSEGTFESPVRDAKLTASWGRFGGAALAMSRFKRAQVTASVRTRRGVIGAGLSRSGRESDLESARSVHSMACNSPCVRFDRRAIVG